MGHLSKFLKHLRIDYKKIKQYIILKIYLLPAKQRNKTKLFKTILYLCITYYHILIIVNHNLDKSIYKHF